MQTGDILIGRRFSGDGAEWMLLSGGFANHAAIIFEEPIDKAHPKYVYDCPRDMGYIEGSTGVRKMLLSEWIDEHLEQDYEIVWLPLAKNLRTFGELNEYNLENWLRHI